MKEVFFRFISLIFIALLSFSSIKSQDFIAKIDTTGVLCETTFSDVVLNLEQTAPLPMISIYGFRFVVTYDHHHVQFDSISYTHGYFKDSLQFTHVEDTIFLQVDTVSNGLPFDSGTLFKLRFSGVKLGLTEIGFHTPDCYLLASNIDSTILSYEPVQVTINPGHLDVFLEQTNWGCSYENKGQAYITILDGVAPYQYEWQTSPIQTDTFAQGLWGGEQHIYITDGNRCVYDTSINIEIIPAPNFQWATEPDSNHLVIEKLIKFFVTDEDGGMNWYWQIIRSGSNDTVEYREKNPEHIFLQNGEYIVLLSAKNMDGCDTTIQKVITVLPIELDFKNVITPNENRFKIKIADQNVPLSDVFVKHEVLIYNRVGKMVYKTDNFPEEGWDGDNLGDGTYYYVLKAETLKDKYYYRGNLVILGKK